MHSQPAENPTIAAHGVEVMPCNYAVALRVIGQELTQLFPRVLEIDTDGNSFEARGESHPNPFETIQDGLITRTVKKLRGIQPARSSAAPASFVLRYGPSEIEQIDQLNRTHRSASFRRADIYSLAERLRTLGAIVDAKKGRLKHLHKEADRFVVEYWDSEGQLQTTRLTTVILYRNQEQLDRQRSTGRTELWEGYDF